MPITISILTVEQSLEMIHTISMTTDTEMQTLSAQKKRVLTTVLMYPVSLLPTEIMTMATEGFLITPN